MGYFYPIHKIYMTQTCNKNIEKQLSVLIKQSSVSSNILSSELYFLQIKMAESEDT